jgi:hypothetical protein
MGTTQRIVPGITGEPNWGALSRSITSIAKTVEKESQTENESNITPEEIKKEYKKLIDRREKHIRAAFNNLVQTGGGAKAVSSGSSKSLGRAGFRSAIRISSFFSGVSQNGLQAELQAVGFGTLTGKTVRDIIDFLVIYASETNSGMDETAASKASCELFDEIARQAGDDLEEFEKLLKEAVDVNGLSTILCRFWGLYIFEHLSQRFEEKIEQEKGGETKRETFKIIKEYILGQVELLNTRTPIGKINWSGDQGSLEVSKIFESIINILSDED